MIPLPYDDISSEMVVWKEKASVCRNKHHSKPKRFKNSSFSSCRDFNYGATGYNIKTLSEYIKR